MAEGSGMRRLLLVGLGLILLAVVGMLVYNRLVEPAVPSSVAGLAGEGATARQALAPAAELAAQWQEDARLTAVSCQWLVVGMRPGGEAEWAFQFFSPSTQRLALITVASGAAHKVRESPSPYAVPTFSTEEWRVDSDRALQVWVENGGGDWLARRPDTDLAMQLRIPDGGSEQPVWIVVGLIISTDDTLTVVMNATDGALVEP